MRLLLTLLMAFALVSCGKKSDDQKPATQEQPSKTLGEQSEGQVGQIDSIRSQPQTELTDEQSAVTPDPRKPLADPLKNKRWKLVQLKGELIEVTDDFRSEPYITLSAYSNKMTGSGGCNRFGCKYDLRGDKISFNGFAATKVMCKDAMQVEDPFLRELALVTSYTMDGEDRMWLLHDGKRVMQFEAVYVN